MDNFFEMYDSYISTPVCFLIGLFYQIDKNYQEYIAQTYGPDDISRGGLTKADEFYLNGVDCEFGLGKCGIMGIINNKDIFIKKYYTNYKNTKYLNVIALKEVVPFAAYFCKFFVMTTSFDELNDSCILYQVNLNTGYTIVDITNFDKLQTIKNAIAKNFILVANIMEYCDDYEQKEGMIGDTPKELRELYEHDDYKSVAWKTFEDLYADWTRPIEPTDNDFKKLTDMALSRTKKIIGEYEYTDIICYRNFLQRDFKAKFETLYNNCSDITQSELNTLPILLTTYRTKTMVNQEYYQYNPITILH